MWLIVLSDQLPIVALVSCYPTNQLIGHGPSFQRRTEARLCSGLRRPEPMRYCRRFLAGIPHWKAGDPCVTHPSATPSSRKTRAYDLHVLGTPPAFILSQDQTRHPNVCESLNGDSAVVWSSCGSSLLEKTQRSRVAIQAKLLLLCISTLGCSQMYVSLHPCRPLTRRAAMK